MALSGAIGARLFYPPTSTQMLKLLM
ncbi:uncharacterized protein G2W53_022873 [Senna tora]|uniref:Uncharacterized protein n=1 Tax=Senna tora TaxID=362788 RepID=A0A834TV26_9FABA|nr:uncharacterized protein G2W53_022873 [Senna tora]